MRSRGTTTSWSPSPPRNCWSTTKNSPNWPPSEVSSAGLNSESRHTVTVSLRRSEQANPMWTTPGSHKRFDPVYSDAKMRSKDIGDFSFFNSYMSQPKSQLQTFSAWAGVDSDISYYLNSHHVSLIESTLADDPLMSLSRPIVPPCRSTSTPGWSRVFTSPSRLLLPLPRESLPRSRTTVPRRPKTRSPC